MSRTIYLNGRFIAEDEARIGALDGGYLFGEGVFETLRADWGRPFRLTEHLERLRRGLRLLELSEPDGLEESGALCARLLRLNRLAGEPAAIKLAVSRGPAENGASPPTFLVRATALDQAAMARRRAGLRAGIVPWRRDRLNPLLGIKSLNYLENRLALKWARRQGCDEGIFVNLEGELCEGTFSNLFLVLGETIFTAPESSGLLAGITRGFILETAPALGLEIRREALSPAQLEACSGAFVTSSLMDLAPLLELGGVAFDAEATGKLQKRLRQAFAASRQA